MLFVSKQSLHTAIENFINGLSLDYLESYDIIRAIDMYNIDCGDDIESTLDKVDDYDNFQQEVIYDHKAMEFLSDNDNSLSESLRLAEELGYGVSDLNSELLASILKTQYCIDEWYEVKDAIQDEFKYAETLEWNYDIDVPKDEQELNALQSIVDAVNDDGKEWFSCVIDDSSLDATVHVFINQQGLNESEVLEHLDYITQEQLDESEDIKYMELDLSDLSEVLSSHRLIIVE